METTLGRHVQWLDDSGGWQVGRALTVGGVEMVRSEYTASHAGIIIAHEVLVMPQHSRLPVFVEAGKLVDRPDHDTLKGGA